MSQEYTSVFDVIGRVVVTPSDQHIAEAFRLGQALHPLLPQLQRITWQLDGTVSESSLDQALQLAITAGMVGIDELTTTTNVLEVAYKHGISVSFVPNSKHLNQPHTVQADLVSVDHQTIKLVFTSDALKDQFALTQINDDKLTLQPGAFTMILSVDEAVTGTPQGNLSPLIHLNDQAFQIFVPDAFATDLVAQLEALPHVNGVTLFR
ncbi:hypothetical protein [Lacticaseibacillus saniviri]|uniref:Uncharacterized protein n=3 Tax=Lacticaseibacillus saniviri TaxID=931533 RepID=A0A0R2MQU0_9LACO|nr:hypothetical protein [Lacticaseibacillus saniviri]KRO15100.1 hypothetical protein IV56_GL000188 [Lacticaseibacillus saniviri JCM 17471 = DSM 24301]